MLYELGYSHAMNKEAILIYEEKDKETKFPFDSSAIIFSLQEGIKFNISQLDMCIEELNEERKMVYLEVIDKE